MTGSSSIAWSAYRGVVWFALPGMLWSAYEMFGLTIGGPQMLFFSAAHGAGLIMLLVALSIIAAPLWLLQSVLAVVLASYSKQLNLPNPALKALVLTVGGHLLLLITYDEWSTLSARIWVCMLGLSLTAAMLYYVVRYVLAVTEE